MNATELRGKNTEELQRMAQEWSKEIFLLQLKKAGHQLEKPARLRALRQDYARVLTVLRERNGTTV